MASAVETSARFLSEEDVALLTGKRQHAAQVRFLRRIGLSPIVRDDGRPIVTWEAVHRVITGKAEEAARPQLNLDAIQRPRGRKR